MPPDDTQSAPDPNNPANYTPSLGVQAVAPVIAQLTGGDKGNTLAGIQGAQGADNSWITDIGATIQKAIAPLASMFSAYQQGKSDASAPQGNTVSSNPSTLAGQAVSMGQTKGNAEFLSGMAKAQADLIDNANKARAAADTIAEGQRLGLDPGNPQVIQQEANFSDASKSLNTHIANINQMRDVNFFDNPGGYLLNHLIKLPIEEGRAEDALGTLKDVTEQITASQQALTGRSAIDLAMENKDQTQKAALLYQAAVGQAISAGVTPMMDAQRQELGAWNLGVSQGQLSVSQGELQLNKQRLEQERGFQAANLATSRGELAVRQGQLSLERARLEQEKVMHGDTLEYQKKDLDLRNREADLRDKQLQMAQELHPLEVEGKKKANDWYDASRQSLIEQQQATAAERAQQTLDRVNKNKADAADLSTVQNMYAWFGGSPQAITDLKRIDQKQLPSQLAIAHNLQTFGQIGANPAESLWLLQDSGMPTSKLSVGEQQTIQAIANLHINTSIREANRLQAVQGRMSPDEKKDYEWNYTNTAIAREQDNITSKNTFFQMPSLDKVVDIKGLKDNLIVQELRPLTVDKTGETIRGRETDGGLFLNTAARLVAEGKLSENDAVTQLDQIGANVLDTIQSSKYFKEVGIPVRKQFPVTYQKPGFVQSSPDSVDLMNSADTLTKLRAMVGSYKSKDMIQKDMGLDRAAPWTTGP